MFVKGLPLLRILCPFFSQGPHCVKGDYLCSIKVQLLNWFGSPYYTKLYRHRNELEAQQFIQNLLNLLAMDSDAYFADICCGRGRHARYLAELGYRVVGIDACDANIKYAREFENEGLSFSQQDILEPLSGGPFDVALNLFTSFGYFDTQREHLTALKNIRSTLKEQSVLIIDYLNSYMIKREAISEESEFIDGVRFDIKKYTQNGYAMKEIDVNDQGTIYNFRERVRLFGQSDFSELLTKAGFKLEAVYGDYEFNEYRKTSSDRMILVSRAK